MNIAFVIQIEIFDGHIKSGGYWVICIKLCLVEFAECKRNLHAVFFKCTKYIGIIIQGNRRFQIILVKPVLSYDQAIEYFVVIGRGKPGRSEFNDVAFVTSDFLLNVRVTAFFTKRVEFTAYCSTRSVTL